MVKISYDWIGFTIFWNWKLNFFSEFLKATFTQLCMRDARTISVAVKRAPKQSKAEKTAYAKASMPIKSA